MQYFFIVYFATINKIIVNNHLLNYQLNYVHSSVLCFAGVEGYLLYFVESGHSNNFP